MPLPSAVSLLMARLGPHGNARFTSGIPPAPDLTDTPAERLNRTAPAESGRDTDRRATRTASTPAAAPARRRPAAARPRRPRRPRALSTTFPKAGTHAMDARVTGLARDALPDDDVRYLSIEVRETTPVLLVDGRPGATLLTGQAGFLALALAPERPSFSRLDVSTFGRFDVSTPVDPKVVTVSELVTAVNIAMGGLEHPPHVCLPADTDMDREVSISELVEGVMRAVQGCE